jgi:phosphohistidine phosphatase
MRLYLVQHGEARSRSEDPERPLTKQGREDVSRTAAFARQAGVNVDQIRHSGKLRAVETAAILAEQLKPTHGVVATPELSPQGDVGSIAELLDRETRPLMFVGHLPFMERLTGRLVAGDKECPVVRFQKGGIVCLERDPRLRSWSVLWVVIPELILPEGGQVQEDA